MLNHVKNIRNASPWRQGTSKLFVWMMHIMLNLCTFFDSNVCHGFRTPKIFAFHCDFDVSGSSTLGSDVSALFQAAADSMNRGLAKRK
mmetsp:Transcript_13186/g.18888  ORF Transcript_13186/g.18888 Transcript_13186/m.18888 type:complete len:88 (+) Transcript_13186:114-377(+)